MQIVQLALSDAQYHELAHLASRAGVSIEELLPQLLPQPNAKQSSDTVNQTYDFSVWILDMQKKGVLLPRTMAHVAYDAAAFARAAEEAGASVSGEQLVSQGRDD